MPTTTIDFNNLSSSLQTTITQGGGPKITSLDYPGDDTAADPAGGQTITVNGSSFVTGFSIAINGQLVGSVTFISSTEVTFVSPALSAGSYPLYLINPDGGTAILVPGIQYSGVPTWTTPAGSLGNVYETSPISTTVVATADSAITYSLASGTLPTGSTLAANGLISGTSTATENPTTFTFVIKATDAELQDTNRTFNLTVNPDVVTWVSPANGTTYTIYQNETMANVTMSATSAAGFGITYTANSLPTGLSITGANIAGTPTVVGSSSTLLTATASTSNRSATRTINWVVDVSNDTYFDYVTTLLSANTPSTLPFNDDASTNNFNVSIFGDTKPSNWGPYQDGYYSNYFDGTGDYLAVPNNAAFNFGTSNFTVECWIYWISGDFCVFGGTSSGATDLVYYSNSFRFGRYNTAWDTTLSYTLTAGQWYHIAFIKESGTAKVYVNGTLAGSASNGISYDTAGGPMNINASGDGSRQGNIYFSNHRVVKGTAVYTGTFTPSTTPLTAIANTSLLTCQSNRFIDNSTNNFTITRNGDTKISGYIPYTPSSSYSTYGSTYFDGTGDYLSVPDNTALRLSSTDFTIEFWGYQTTTSDTTTGYFSKGNDYALDNDANRFVLRVSGGNTFVLGGRLDQNTWTHLALVRNGGTITLYKNGVSLGSASSPTITDSASPLLIGWCSVGSGALFTGYISNFRLVKGTAVYTGAFTPPTSPLTAIANTSLLTTQTNQPVNNNVFVDEGTNNFLVTRNGNTTQGTFSPYGVNYSNYFDGTGDYLTTPVIGAGNGSGLFTTGATFTVEAWMYQTATVTTAGYVNNLIGDLTPTTASALWWAIGADATNAPVYRWYDGTVKTCTGASALALNTWNHVAFVCNAGTLSIYVNGTSQTLSGTTTISTPAGTQSNLYIGADRGYYVTGYISNLRVVKNTALYTSSFTPSTTPLQPIANTQLLTCANNNIVDRSANNFTITRNGDTSVQKFGPFSGVTLPTPYYSAYFDGNGDYLTVPDNTALQMGSGDFTIEFYIYYTSIAGYVTPFSKGYTGAGDILFQTGNGNGAMVIYLSGSAAITESTGAIVNQWYHYALVRSGTTVTLYRNGVSTGTATSSVNFNSSQQVGIGATGTAPAGGSVGQYPVTGYMSNVRLVKGTAVYTGAFTPPTSPLTAIANTSLLTCQSATFIDNSTNNFTITANGNSQPTLFNPFTLSYSAGQAYSASVFGGSMYFDGSGDYLSITASELFAQPGNFTVECWAYFTASSAANQYIFSCDKNNYIQFGRSAAGKILANQGGVGDLLAGTTTLNNNTWYHLAMSRSSSTLRLFVNGALDASGTYSTSITGLTNPLGIGALTTNPSAYPVTGYISDLRFTQGSARYTNNFVPPQAPVTAVQNTSLLLNGTTGGIIDSSEIATFETVGDSKINTAITKFSGKASMSFDGTGDFVQTFISNINLVFGTGNFTVECWVYFNTSGQHGIFQISTNAGGFNTSNANSIAAQRSATGQWEIYANGTNPQQNATINQSQWYHIAIARSGTTTRFFVDGSVTITVSSDSTNYTGSYVGLGAIYSTAVPLNGYISDFRITKGIARYTTTFTPPTQPFIQY